MLFATIADKSAATAAATGSNCWYPHRDWAESPTPTNAHCLSFRRARESTDRRVKKLDLQEKEERKGQRWNEGIIKTKQTSRGKYEKQKQK